MYEPVDGEQLFPISVLDRMRGNELTLKHEGFRLNLKKNFLDVGVTGLWNELLRCLISRHCLFWPQIFESGCIGCMEGGYTLKPLSN